MQSTLLKFELWRPRRRGKNSWRSLARLQGLLQDMGALYHIPASPRFPQSSSQKSHTCAISWSCSKDKEVAELIHTAFRAVSPAEPSICLIIFHLGGLQPAALPPPLPGISHSTATGEPPPERIGHAGTLRRRPLEAQHNREPCQCHPQPAAGTRGTLGWEQMEGDTQVASTHPSKLAQRQAYSVDRKANSMDA